MGRRLASAILITLLVVIHVQLWSGRGSLPQVNQLKQRLDEQNQRNSQAQVANNQLAAEVRDLKEGLDMVEGKARKELGMIKPNEIYVQISH